MKAQTSLAAPVRTQVLNITPEIAATMLETNRNFRKVSPGRVSMFVRDMVAGHWHFNGETIKFNQVTNELIDGQHRLSAIIQSGVTVPCLCVWVATDKGVDRGMARTIAQLLYALGYKNAASTSSAVNVLFAYYGHVNLLTRHVITDAERETFINTLNSSRLTEAVTLAERCRAAGFGKSGAWGAAIYLFLELDADAARDFINRVIEGTNLAKHDPALTLRNKLITLHSFGRSGQAARLAMFTFIVKAWNAYRSGLPLTLLRQGDLNALPKPV